MPRVILYCQYLSGMGHLVRSTELVRALSSRFRVTFINGGPRVDGHRLPDGVETVYLPALWLENGAFRVAEGDDVEEVKTARRRRLIELFDIRRPDCVITEFFPFGRHDLLFELQPWMDHIAAVAPQTVVVSSLRDTIGKTTLASQSSRIAELVNRYFDLVLYHSDARFQPFVQCFPAADQLRCRVAHTGFVAQRLATEPPPAAEPRIVVSVGGGRLGYAVLEAAIAAAGLLETRLPHVFHLYTGPFMPDDDYARLDGLACRSANVRLRRFTPNLLSHMTQSELSISLAGYNTTMNVLRSGTRAIMVPIGHYDFDHEQLQRTRKLAERGLARVVLPDDLDADALATAVVEELDEPRRRAELDLDGAQRSAELIASQLRCDATVGFAQPGAIR